MLQLLTSGGVEGKGGCAVSKPDVRSTRHTLRLSISNWMFPVVCTSESESSSVSHSDKRSVLKKEINYVTLSDDRCFTTQKHGLEYFSTFKQFYIINFLIKINWPKNIYWKFSIFHEEPSKFMTEVTTCSYKVKKNISRAEKNTINLLIDGKSYCSTQIWMKSETEFYRSILIR